MATTTPARTGNVRILREEMAAVLGEWALTAEPVALAATGSLLLRITSDTKAGPVTATYRVEAVDSGFMLRKGQVGANGKWLADGRGEYTIDTSFDASNPRCDCPDARHRGIACKHLRALKAVAVLS